MRIEIDKSGVDFIIELHDKILENKNNIFDDSGLVKFKKLFNIIRSSKMKFILNGRKHISSKEELYELYGFSKEQISHLMNNNDDTSIFSVIVRHICDLSFDSTLDLNSFQLKKNENLSFEKQGIPTILNITNEKSLDYLTIPISSNNNSISKLVNQLFNFNSFALALPEFLNREDVVERVFSFTRQYLKNIDIKGNNSNVTIFYCVNYMKDFRYFKDKFGWKSKYWVETPEILYFAKDIFDEIDGVDFEFVPLDKKMEKDQYLDRYFFSPFNYSSFQHFFGKNDSTQWIQNDFYSADKSNYDIQENLNNYKILINKYKKRIDKKHKLYYSNVTHFKNRLFDLNLR